MAIASSDILFMHSGGSSNSDPNASIGGAISSTEIPNSQINNLFDNVSGDEAIAGESEYRCIYIKNSHGSETLFNPMVWITDQPDSRIIKESFELGKAYQGIGDTAAAIANENVAPASVTFSSVASKVLGVPVAPIPAGSYQAIWLKRIVPSNADVKLSASVTIKVEGDTED